GHEPDARELEYERRWYSWSALRRTAVDVARAIQSLGLGAGARVGVLLRNRPVPVGLALGVLRAEACLVTVNPLLGRDRVRTDLHELGLGLVAGEPGDLAELVDARVAAHTATLALADLGGDAQLVPPSEPTAAPSGLPDVAARMLTRSEEHTSELQSRGHRACRLLLEKKKEHKY